MSDLRLPTIELAEERVQSRPMHNRRNRLALLLALMTPLMIWGADLVIPHSFSAGGAIRADEMNANFDAIRAAINTHGSGSRLKVLNLKGPDGFVQSIQPQQAIAWDSQLQMTCAIGYGYCLPMFFAYNYSDPACSVLVAADWSTGTVGAYLGAFGGDAGAFMESPRYAVQRPTLETPTMTFFRIGAQQTANTYQLSTQYLGDGGTQTVCTPQGTRGFYPITGTEPESTFARVVLSVE